MSFDDILPMVNITARPKFRKFFKLLSQGRNGYSYDFNSIYRDANKQNILYEEKTSPIKGGNSKHNFAAAIDINVTTNRGEELKKVGTKELWESEGIVRYAKSCGLGWGGDFSVEDSVHFYYDFDLKKARSNSITQYNKPFESLTETEIINLNLD